MRRILTVVLALCFGIPQAYAWGNRGHELVAYIAYTHLDPATQKKVDALIQLNPCYKEWNTSVSSLPAAQQPLAIFMLAATWPDKIKLAAPLSKTPYDCQPGFNFSKTDGAVGKNGRVSVDVAPDVPDASQNIGYTDDRRHQYWHFIDQPMAADGVATQPAGKVNVLTEVELLSTALATKEDPALASYDLVWLEHLTGDLHQPLHDAQRFSTAFPNGDAGGNLVQICPGTTPCREELHGYWDDLPGSDSSLIATIKMGATIDPAAPPADDAIDIDHPENWAASSLALAQSDVYTAPFTPEAKNVDPTAIPAAYKAKAMDDMKQQIVIAGYRLNKMISRGLAS